MEWRSEDDNEIKKAYFHIKEETRATKQRIPSWVVSEDFYSKDPINNNPIYNLSENHFRVYMLRMFLMKLKKKIKQNSNIT